MQFFLVLLIAGQVSAASWDELSDSFAKFRADKKAHLYKHRYLELIAGFQKFAHTSPTSDRADDALMNASRLLEDIAHITRQPKDFREAEKNYLAIVQKYPDSELADLALYRAARIRAGELRDRATASKILTKNLAIADRNLHWSVSQSLFSQLGIVPVKKPSPSVIAKKETSESRRTHSMLELRPKKIVIDAGHGGDDPGAIGKSGLREKDVTLAIAKQIKKLIERDMPDIRVYLTRDDDRFIPLPKRTEIANQLEADLFISIHVNAAHNRDIAGIETYYLDITHDRYGIRLAARENAMSETEISNLEYILADLAMKSNVSDSIRLGHMVQTSTHLNILQDWDDSKNLGLKHALFYVLLGARMPAILVETSFISNRTEEKRLKTEHYRHALAEGVVKGIRRYIEDKQAVVFR